MDVLQGCFYFTALSCLPVLVKPGVSKDFLPAKADKALLPWVYIDECIQHMGAAGEWGKDQTFT